MTFDAEKFVQRQWEIYRESRNLLSDHDRANELAQAAYELGRADERAQHKDSLVEISTDIGNLIEEVKSMAKKEDS